MNLPKMTVLMMGLILVLAFQNCGNSMSFQQDGSLVAKADEDTNGDGIPDDPSADDGNLNPGDGAPPVGATPRPGASPSPDPRATPRARDTAAVDATTMIMMTMKIAKTDRARDDDDRDHSDDDDDDDYRTTATGASFVCILDGPGKSIKIGHRSADLAGGNAADSAVCMSENACLGIASKVFSVKQAERRGFCEQAIASGRVALSDAQVEEAVTRVKLLQLSTDTQD